ncbi:MAG: ChaN family lipoprotein [Thiohalocapsa sp.]|nr:ChaN family lipoprotein [Thiohalocapsa sp.]
MWSRRQAITAGASLINSTRPFFAAALALAVTSSLAAEAAILPGADEIIDTQTSVVDVSELENMSTLLDRLQDKRVIFVGESHDRYEDHLNQLAIIRGLHARGKDIAIGMEFFQQPFQAQLDAFVAGELSEADLLRRTEYFERWRFDYRLYRPLLRFAREAGLPVIALNIEREITEKVGDAGIESLSDSEAARLPEIDRTDEAYRRHVEAVFDMHPKGDDADVEHFLDVQLLWDESMAERAARYLREHPEKTLVVLAGAGHVEYGRGIPQRVARRLPVPSATVINGTMRPFDPDAADFILFPRRVELPSTGLLGVMLDTESDGAGLGVRGFSDNSGAKSAGVKEGDRIVGVGGNAIESYADIRIALMDSRPGQKLPVEVVRKSLVGGPEQLTFEVEPH